MFNFASNYSLDTTSNGDLYSNLYTNSSYDVYASVPQGLQIWGIIALILAIIGGILIYFLFIRSKNPVKGKFAKWLKDFLSFKVMWIEPILKVVYYAATIYVMLLSFSFLGMGAGGYGFLMFLLATSLRTPRKRNNHNENRAGLIPARFFVAFSYK